MQSVRDSLWAPWRPRELAEWPAREPRGWPARRVRGRCPTRDPAGVGARRPLSAEAVWVPSQKGTRGAGEWGASPAPWAAGLMLRLLLAQIRARGPHRTAQGPSPRSGPGLTLGCWSLMLGRSTVQTCLSSAQRTRSQG